MSDLQDILRGEIDREGAISFARFMELSLYCPKIGYYEQSGVSPGRKGDFYTSVSVGELFGDLLANQFAEWLAPEAQSQISNLKSQINDPTSHVGAYCGDNGKWQIV
ncbi:MAG TPA: hypothetical protein VG754_01635 [Verrucomicrobiae bacterium]|nr:hypothetical protein [Verrucomicrobiae bacterium]